TLDVAQAGDPGHPRAPRGPADALAHPPMAAVTRFTSVLFVVHARSAPAHLVLPALPDLPALRRRRSPRYRTPLPLYGSGLRNDRILAATCPTVSLSAPLMTICVGTGTSMVMPSGGE